MWMKCGNGELINLNNAIRVYIDVLSAATSDRWLVKAEMPSATFALAVAGSHDDADAIVTAIFSHIALSDTTFDFVEDMPQPTRAQ